MPMHTASAMTRSMRGSTAGAATLLLMACAASTTAPQATPTATAVTASPTATTVTASPTATAVTASPSASSSASSSSDNATAVTVTETEFKIELSTSTFQAGPYTLTIKNGGTVTHALEIDGPGVTDKTSARIRPGSSTTMTVVFQKGTYDVYCPVDGHRAMGMHTQVTAD